MQVHLSATAVMNVNYATAHAEHPLISKVLQPGGSFVIQISIY